MIQFIRQNRRLPNGRVTCLEIIKHPGAVLVVPFLSKDKIIFIKQFRPVINAYICELPAGTLKKNERPRNCAQREMIEEIGYSAGQLTRLGKIVPVPGYSTEVITIFKAENLKKQHATHQEPDEIIKLCPFDRSMVQNLFRQRKITDAKTICALAYCGWI